MAKVLWFLCYMVTFPLWGLLSLVIGVVALFVEDTENNSFSFDAIALGLLWVTFFGILYFFKLVPFLQIKSWGGL